MPNTYHRNRFLLLCGFAVALACYWFGGEWFGIPSSFGFDISLLRQPSAPFIVMIVAAVTWISVIVTSLIAGVVRADAGLFCTTLGMMALSIRGGTIFPTIAGAGAGVFIALAIELLLLFAIVFVGWLIILKMADLGLVRADDEHFLPDDDNGLDQKLIATATHAFVMLTLMWVFCQSMQKKQVLASVFISSLLASLLAGMFAPTRPSFWYWISPFCVGIVGYVRAGLWGTSGLAIGHPTGTLASLAYPLPIDYAGMGTAGAMLGYWFAHAWHREREQHDRETEDRRSESPTDSGSVGASADRAAVSTS